MDIDDENNPFADKTIRKPATPVYSNISGDDRNPFGGPTVPPAQPIPTARQPTTTTPYLPSPQPPAYDNTISSSKPVLIPEPATTRVDLGDYDRREAALAEREERLAERERSLTNLAAGTKAKNFPPLPKFFPCGPCFYQDISVDIPLQFQARVRTLFYLWLLYVAVLFLNMIAAIAFMVVDWSDGAVTFGLSLLYFVLFVPASYMFWFRAIYRAFRNDSSFYFLFFFFIDFLFLLTNVLFATGLIPGMCGFFRKTSLLSDHLGVGIIMLILGALWSAVCAITVVLTIIVHRIYKGTGASIEKAQEEFKTSVVNNQTVRGAAREVARAGINEAVRSTDDGRPIY